MMIHHKNPGWPGKVFLGSLIIRLLAAAFFASLLALTTGNGAAGYQAFLRRLHCGRILGTEKSTTAISQQILYTIVYQRYRGNVSHFFLVPLTAVLGGYYS